MTTAPKSPGSRLTDEERQDLQRAVSAALTLRESRGWARSSFTVSIDHFVIEAAVEQILGRRQSGDRDRDG